jgi:hypothetical protein
MFVFMATNYTFNTAQGKVTFAVYQGQDCPEANVGQPGDVFAGRSNVFVKTMETWQLYPMADEPSKRIRHPEHPQRVLYLKDGQYVWMTLSAFRVRKSRTAGKDIKCQPEDDKPTTTNNLPHEASDSGRVNDQSATPDPPATVPSSSGIIQGQWGIVIIIYHVLILTRYPFCTRVVERATFSLVCPAPINLPSV